MATDSAAIIRAVFPASAQKIALADPRIAAELQTGFIEQYSGSNPKDCAQVTNPTSRAAYSDSGLGLLGDLARPNTTTGAKISASIDTALKAIPVVGQFLSMAWNTINPFVHHAQAVAKEQGTLCSLVPQVNNTLAATDAAVRSGQISAAQGEQQLESMVSAFDDATSGIYKECNAACVMRGVVRAEADIHEEGYRNAPMYYVKKYWWVAALGLILFIVLGRD